MKKLLLSLCLILAGLGAASAQAPSIGSLIKAIQQCTPSNPQPVANMLDAAGYTYRFNVQQPDYGYEASTTYVYSKNCKVVHEERVNGVKYAPVPETANASIIEVTAYDGNVQSIDVSVYSHSVFKTWVAQLKALGYRSTGEGGSGNQGRDWQYACKGKPKISIWNDYSNTYSLYISK